MKLGYKILYLFICIYFVLVPLLPSTFEYKNIPINSNIILILILLFYISIILMSRESRKRFLGYLKDISTDHFCMILLMMIVLLFISTLYAADRRVALKEALRYTSYFMLFFIIKYEIDDKDKIDILLKIYMCMNMIVGSIAVAQYFIYMHSAQYKGLQYIKISSTLDNSNILSAFLMLSLFPQIVFMINVRNRRKKILYGLSAMVVTAGILLTYSRNALLGLIIGAILLSIVYSKKIILYIIGFGGLSLLIPKVFQRFVDILNVSQNTSRLKIWKTAIYMIKDNPILGIGSGNFPVLYNSYIKVHPELKYYYNSGIAIHPHNLFLKIQCELGIPGTIIFLLLLVVLFMRYKAFLNNDIDYFHRWFYIGFAISLCVFLFMNLLDSFFSTPKVEIYLWSLIAIQQSIIYHKLCDKRVVK